MKSCYKNEDYHLQRTASSWHLTPRTSQNYVYVKTLYTRRFKRTLALTIMINLLNSKPQPHIKSSDNYKHHWCYRRNQSHACCRRRKSHSRCYVWKRRTSKGVGSHFSSISISSNSSRIVEGNNTCRVINRKRSWKLRWNRSSRGDSLAKMIRELLPGDNRIK